MGLGDQATGFERLSILLQAVSSSPEHVLMLRLATYPFFQGLRRLFVLSLRIGSCRLHNIRVNFVVKPAIRSFEVSPSASTIPYTKGSVEKGDMVPASCTPDWPASASAKTITFCPCAHPVGATPRVHNHAPLGIDLETSCKASVRCAPSLALPRCPNSFSGLLAGLALLSNCRTDTL